MNRWFAAVTLPAPSTPRIDPRAEVDAALARNARPPATLGEGRALGAHRARSVPRASERPALLPAGPTEPRWAAEIAASRRYEKERRALVEARGLERERATAHSRETASSAAAISPDVLDRDVAPDSEETQWYELVGRLFEYKQHRRRWLGERGHVHADVIDIP